MGSPCGLALPVSMHTWAALLKSGLQGDSVGTGLRCNSRDTGGSRLSAPYLPLCLSPPTTPFHSTVAVQGAPGYVCQGSLYAGSPSVVLMERDDPQPLGVVWGSLGLCGPESEKAMEVLRTDPLLPAMNTTVCPLRVLLPALGSRPVSLLARCDTRPTWGRTQR